MTEVEQVRSDTAEGLQFKDPEQPIEPGGLFDYISDDLLRAAESAANVEVDFGAEWTTIGRGHHVLVWKALGLVKWETNGAGAYCGNGIWRQARTGGREVWTLNARYCGPGDYGGNIALA